MKSLPVVLLAVFFLASCVFEEPFVAESLLPVDKALIGSWIEVPVDPAAEPNRLLVLQHSANEYLVQFPVGEKAMFFRAFAVDLAGEHCIQIQLIGTADGAVKTEDRKYHLLKAAAEPDQLEIRTIKPEMLGKDLRGTEALGTAFAAHKDHAELFGEPMKFRRVKER